MDTIETPATSVSPSNKSGRVYPTGKRLTKGDATMGSPHSPQDEQGVFVGNPSPIRDVSEARSA